MGEGRGGAECGGRMHDDHGINASASGEFFRDGRGVEVLLSLAAAQAQEGTGPNGTNDLVQACVIIKAKRTYNLEF